MPSSRSVRIEKAHKLLSPGIPANSGGVWADLGCGDGIFTTALCSVLGPGGEIYAVDKSQHALRALVRKLADDYADASVHPIRADFTGPLALPPLDGVVMANSMHFVSDKDSVTAQVAAMLKPGGRLIVVEYNTSRGNYAVPHPLDEYAFLKLVNTAGLCDAQIISRIPSTFLGEMYAGLAHVPLRRNA